MEPEGSLPHSQVPATFLYPEPASYSPYLHIVPPEDPSEYYPPFYAWISQAAFPLVSKYMYGVDNIMATFITWKGVTAIKCMP
jgi:hypothetical protein